MSNDAAEDHWQRRYEKLERHMEEEMAKKDKKIDKLEKTVNRLEGLLANAVNQINTITLEMNSAKKAAAMANARRIGAKSCNKKGKASKSTHNRTGRESSTDIDEEVTADASICDACGDDHLSEVLDEYERVITEVEQIKTKVTRITVKRRRCTNCKKNSLR